MFTNRCSSKSSDAADAVAEVGRGGDALQRGRRLARRRAAARGETRRAPARRRSRSRRRSGSPSPVRWKPSVVPRARERRRARILRPVARAARRPRAPVGGSVDRTAAQAHGARAHDRPAAGAQLRLDDLEAPPGALRPRRRRRAAPSGTGPEELVGDPRDEHVRAGLERARSSRASSAAGAPPCCASGSHGPRACAARARTRRRARSKIGSLTAAPCGSRASDPTRSRRSRRP